MPYPIFQGKGPGAGTGSSDGSGAGYGGTGGSGRVTMTTGAPYGDYTKPVVFGSGGGLGSSAGSGGGVLSLDIAEALVVEGKFQFRVPLRGARFQLSRAITQAC